MKRRLISIFSALCLIITLMTGCAQTPAGTDPTGTGTTAAGTTDEGTTAAGTTAAGTTAAGTTDAGTTAAGTTAADGAAEPIVGAITTNGGAVIELSTLAYQNASSASSVYYISAITPEALMAIYDALEWSPTGDVGIKLSTGEPPSSNYLDPNLIKNLVQAVSGTIVECNTAYGGSRSSTAAHYQVAADHGYTAIAPFRILDENGSMTLTVNGGTELSENYVGAGFADYDSYIVLSHFKGHAMAGFGGAIKNISIGFGSAEGKCWIHSAGNSRTNPWGGNQDDFCEAMGDAGKSVSDYLGNGERIVYINVMNNLSIDCDCDGNPARPDIHNIGILASTDPVALDQACMDLIAVSEGNASFMNRVNNRNGMHTLENAAAIGLGSREYRLVDIGADGLPTSSYVGAGVSYSETPDVNLSLPEVILIVLTACVLLGSSIFVIVYVRKKKKKTAA